MYVFDDGVRSRENLRLNLASPIKGEIRPKQDGRVVLRVDSSMVKATLLEVYPSGASLNGHLLACYRQIGVIMYPEIKDRNMNYSQPDCVHNLKMESGQPKEDVGQNLRTMGLPKVINDYGYRGTVVPAGSLLNLYCSSKVETRGRVSGHIIRMFSSDAGNPSTVKSDVSGKLIRLAEHCINHPDESVRSDKIYKMMYDHNLYEIAYNKLKSNPGNMTPGITPTTLDGMSTEVINDIICSLKDESFKFSPGRRFEITKANGKLRPLTPRDKLVQEVMRMILEVIFEPTFTDSSHGFRTGKSCHTALKDIREKFGVATWYIEGDISKCFDSIDQRILMDIVEDKILDRRFTNLIWKALKAGYFEFKEFKQSIVGTPQGSIISPILCNIYMNKLDLFVEKLKLEFDKGIKARANPAWCRFRYLKTKSAWKKHSHNMMMSVPSKDPFDDQFKRLVYVRYADDWIIGIRGSKEEAIGILNKLERFLKSELKLDLSIEKTLITNARTDKALFLGTNLLRASHQTLSSSRFGFVKRNGRDIRMEASLDRVYKKLSEAGFVKDRIPIPRFLWLAYDKDVIITLYNSVYRGIINYFSFANNFNQLSTWTHYILNVSCAKLLAAKFELRSQARVYRKFGRSLKGYDSVGFVPAVYGNKPWKFKSKASKLYMQRNCLSRHSKF